MNEKFETLLQDEEFAKKLFSLEADAEIQSFLAENGVEFSLEEIAAIKAGVKARLENEDEELSDDMLENVAGGASDVDKTIDLVVNTLSTLLSSGIKKLFSRW